MIRKLLLSLVGLTLGLVLSTGTLYAQATASATIEGTVLDKSQGVVSGAEVVITNKATAATRTTRTNDAGGYRFDLLSAGTYAVKVSMPGFSSIVQTVELLVGQTTTVNATLEPGSVSSTIEVAGVAPVVDLEKTSVSQEITPKEVQELPMVGRDVANLAYLAPGVKATDSYDPTKNRYAILSVNGNNGRDVNVTVNGVDNKDNTVGGPVMQLPLEAVEEFQISTQRFSAVNGRSQGAAINMITKSGSNTFHGSAFGYFRDTSLNTDEKDPTGVGPTAAHPEGTISSHPDYTRQQFGGSLGGPIRKDKLFGFMAIEREREHQAQTVDPTSFNELTLAAAHGFADQPASTIPRPFYEWRYNGRLDWVINNRNNAYLSYTSQVNDSLNDQTNSTMDLTEGNFTRNHLIASNFTLNSNISNTMINQFLVGYQYWNNLIDSNTRTTNVIFPNASFGTNTNVPQQSFQKKWQFKDDLSKTIGRHTVQAGVDFIHNPVEGGFFEFNPTLLISFGANPSTILGDPATYPKGFATPGLVTEMSIANGNPYFLVATKQLGLYGQDTWKVTSRLTLNLGLRWDKDFNMIGLSLIKNSRTYQELVALNSPVTNPYVSRLPHDDNKDFSPRVGFAYDLTGRSKHVVRGGFGLYFGNVFQNIPLFMEQQANSTIFQTLFDLLDPVKDIVPGTNIPLGQWRYGVDPMPTIAAPSGQLNPGSIGRLMDPNYRNPVTEEFNGGYSWAVNANTAVEVEYTHVLGLHDNKTINLDQKVPVAGACCTAPLAAAFTANPALPSLGSVREDASIGRSHYDGVNFTFRQQMSHRFQIAANYTLAWAYAYDGGGGSYRTYPRLSTNPFASYEWGPSPNDERHHVTVSGIVDLPKGFQLSPILQFGSARPYNVTNSGNTLNTGGGTFNAVVVPINNPTDYLAFAGNNIGAQNCFYGLNGVTPACTIAKYDPLRGEPFFELDTRLAKNIRFGERMNLQLMAQAFNLTNRANYGNNFGTSANPTAASIASAATFGHPQGFINPASTIIPHALWGELGVRFTF